MIGINPVFPELAVEYRELLELLELFVSQSVIPSYFRFAIR